MKRLQYVDVAKGIAILCMVLGHTNSMQEKPLVYVWIYSFHMPLFFITSGVLYGIRKPSQKYSSLIKKKIRTLLIPYFIWNTVYQIFIGILNSLGGEKNTWFKNLKHIIYFNGSAMWFLPVMFIASIIFLITVKHKFLNIILGIIVGIIGIKMPNYSQMLEVVLRAFVGVMFIEIASCIL